MDRNKQLKAITVDLFDRWYKTELIRQKYIGYVFKSPGGYPVVKFTYSSANSARC